APPAAAAPAPAPTVEMPPGRLQTARVRRGDDLVSVITRAGVRPGRVAHEIAAALEDAGADLRRLQPGDAVEITWSPTDEARVVSWQRSPWLGYAAIAEDGGWSVKVLETTPDVRVALVQGRVERSLFEAIDEVGEEPALVTALVSIFEWDFDFTLDTRRGDRFRLLVEKRHAGDEFVSYGRVLAAQYASETGTLTGIGFGDESRGFHYFDDQGRSLRKSFLKSPLEFSRITSGFTHARPHPILGGMRPHLAIDYAAPVGTPVRAVGDGLVLRAGRNGGNGIQVHLRHRSGYETVYNHLSRVAAGVRAGRRVTQRQVIGYVGSTGLSTGPHLDYRIRKNGVFVNPLGERFTPGEPIPSGERPAFERHAAALIQRLEAEAPF
ncbi:MAG: M23 family metallopeptidase, partial [Candidatus Rokuibacteriota bacterium]